jgi:glycosyl transferase, family 25
VHAYVINLARSLDRRAHIIGELKNTGLDYEIITAVDGRELDPSDLSNPAIVDPSLTTRIGLPAGAVGGIQAGTVGAALSHLSVYRKIIEDELDKALVLEDDIILSADIGSLVDTVADQLTGAEVALLSYESPDPCRMSIEGSTHLPSSRLLALPIDIRWLSSAGAYVITREACERMVKSMLPLRIQADGWWFYYREGVLDRVRCVVPQPVHKNPKLISTIGSYSLGNGLRARLAGPLMHRKIPLLHQVLSYRRQRIYRQWGRSELVEMPLAEKPSRLE